MIDLLLCGNSIELNSIDVSGRGSYLCIVKVRQIVIFVKIYLVILSAVAFQNLILFDVHYRGIGFVLMKCNTSFFLNKMLYCVYGN